MAESAPNATGSAKTGNRILLILAAIAVIAAFAFLPAAEWIESGRKIIAGLGFWAPLVFILFYVLLTVFFVSGAVLTLAAGALFGLIEGVVYASIGSTLGAACAFLIGRYLARDWVARKIAGNQTFSAIDRAVAGEGWKIVGLARLSPVFPFVFLNYAFGLTQVRFSHYLLASWIGMLPGTVLYVYLGYTAQVAANAESAGTAETVLKVVGLLATIGVTVLITKIARKALQQKAQLANETEEET